jgi:hypothetical protein
VITVLPRPEQATPRAVARARDGPCRRWVATPLWFEYESSCHGVPRSHIPTSLEGRQLPSSVGPTHRWWEIYEFMLHQCVTQQRSSVPSWWEVPHESMLLTNVLRGEQRQRRQQRLHTSSDVSGRAIRHGAGSSRWPKRANTGMFMTVKGTP